MTLTRGALAALSAITALVFLLLYGPLLVPIVSSLFTLDHGSILWDQPSLESYAALSRNATILEAVTNTLAVGAAAVVLSLVVGMVMALHYCSGRSAGREIMQFVVFLPFLMPPMVTGLSLLVFFREIDFDRSLVTITIGHTVFILTLASDNRGPPAISRAGHHRGLLRSRRHQLADLPLHLAAFLAGRVDRRRRPLLRPFVR